MSDISLPHNIYDEVLNEETTLDLSSSGLEIIPKINNKLLTALYLQYNKITILPDDFFPSLPGLMWLDLRDNSLTDIPKTIENHQCLTHLLLQNNKLTSLPNEISTVNLKVLQFSGNPLIYPPREILTGGLSNVISFLHTKYIDNIFEQSRAELSEERLSANLQDNFSQGVVSYNSVIDGYKIKQKTLSVKLNEKETADSDEDYYGKLKGKCPKLAKSRHKTLPSYYQSSKYVNTSMADSKEVMNFKIKQNYLRDLGLKKHKNLLATREKILQDRNSLYCPLSFFHTTLGGKEPYRPPEDAVTVAYIAYDTWSIAFALPSLMQNISDSLAHSQEHNNPLEICYLAASSVRWRNLGLLLNWRKEYRIKQESTDGSYRLEPKSIPYDTSPEYMTLLTREDIEKDLPNKYRQRLVRRCKPTIPRKNNNDVHLAMKIKQMFENLEAIDLNRRDMTPRTEQKVLLSEIQKISEIKQKLMELSTTNARSVVQD